MDLEVRYLYHSGFSVSSGDTLLLFDYWEGENGELPVSEHITVEKLKVYQQVFVFISHSHPDHFMRKVYEWGKEVPVTYIISPELPVDIRGTRLWPGDQISVNSRLSVKAFDSTDLGVSFLVQLDGIRIFHAGDLNFWHWREESTVAEIEEADLDFKRACQPIQGQPMDICLFPVDPRQGRLYDAGADYFIMAMKPRLLIPMHFWSMAEVIQEFARRSRSNQTEVIALTQPGERLHIEVEEDGYMTIHVLPPDIPLPDTMLPRDEAVNMAGYEGDDPFWNSDEPVNME